MPQFTVRNSRPTSIEVVIEPWAHVERLEPKAEVLFDYDEPAEVSIAAEENGDLFVVVSGERIRWVANGHEKSFGAS